MLWLERKYLSLVMSSLDMAKWVNENTLNHRCPYCGDSQKNKYKSRGYHFVKDNSFIYKCHNCGKTTSSVNFIKDHFPIQHKEYLKEWLKDQGKKPVQKMPPASKFKFTPREINHLKPLVPSVASPSSALPPARSRAPLTPSWFRFGLFPRGFVPFRSQTRSVRACRSFNEYRLASRAPVVASVVVDTRPRRGLAPARLADVNACLGSSYIIYFKVI